MGNQKIRLFFDENMPIGLAQQLRNRGTDVVTALDRQALGASDLSHLEWAKMYGYVVCSYDRDFTRIDSRGVSHGGIVFVPGDYRDYGTMLNFFLLFRDVYSLEQMKDTLIYLFPVHEL